MSRFQWLTTLKTSHHGSTHKVIQASTGRVCVLKEVRAPRIQVKAAIKAIESTIAYGAECLIDIIDLWDCPINEDVGCRERWHHLFLVVEFVAGGSLKDRIDKRWTNKKALELALDLCHALHAMHQCKLPHGKLKTDCIFFNKRGKVKLANFRFIRLAGQRREETDPDSGGRLLELAYKEDMLAVARVIYAVVTGTRGRKNFTSNISTPVGLVHNLPHSTHPTIKEMIRRASHENPKKRATAAECIEILGGVPRPRLHHKEFDKIAELTGRSAELSDQDSLSSDEADQPWHRARNSLRGKAFKDMKKKNKMDLAALKGLKKEQDAKDAKMKKMERARGLAMSGGIL
jgi:serine/threonine protein kinase